MELEKLIEIANIEKREIECRLEELKAKINPHIAYAGIDGTHFGNCGDGTCSGSCSGGCGSSCAAWD